MMKILITESQVNRLLLEWRGADFDIPYPDYESWDAYLGKRESKKLAGNTYMYRTYDGYSIAVRFYSTDIVTIDVTDKIKLNTNGWFYNNVTRGRLNVILYDRNIKVWSDRNKGYIRVSGHTYKYEDGMCVLPNNDISY